MFSGIGLCSEDENEVGSQFIHFFFEAVQEGDFEILDVGWKTAGMLGIFEFLVYFELNEL